MIQNHYFLLNESSKSLCELKQPAQSSTKSVNLRRYSILNVVKVILQFLEASINRIYITHHNLCPASQSWCHLMSRSIKRYFFVSCFTNLGRSGLGPTNSFPFENVYKLRISSNRVFRRKPPTGVSLGSFSCADSTKFLRISSHSTKFI